MSTATAIDTRPYDRMAERHREEVSAFPIRYAFGNEQFRRVCEELGVTDPGKELASAGAGGFMRRSDVPAWNAMVRRQRAELRDAMKSADFAAGAFLSEMENHEYGINMQADWDVCGCFGRCEYVDGAGADAYLDAMGYGEVTRLAYGRARREYWRLASENEWF